MSIDHIHSLLIYKKKKEAAEQIKIYGKYFWADYRDFLRAYLPGFALTYFSENNLL